MRKDSGYTLVEMMVTVGIFSLAFVVIGAIFLGFSTAQSRATQAQRLLNEVNFLNESITREIRMHGVDYNCGSAAFGTTADYICLRSADGESIHLRVTNPGGIKQVEICRETAVSPCADVDDWSVISPDFLTINSLNFYLYPLIDPGSTTQETSLYQPMTLIQLSAQLGSGRALQQYTLQTAVSSRFYDF